MKHYLVQATVYLQKREITGEDFDLILRNVWMNRFTFIQEDSLQPIELNEGASFQRFTEQGFDIWFLKARGAYVKVVVSPREVTLSSMEAQKESFDLTFYTEIMICLCEHVMIWNFSAQEISAGEIGC